MSGAIARTVLFFMLSIVVLSLPGRSDRSQVILRPSVADHDCRHAEDRTVCGDVPADHRVRADDPVVTNGDPAHHNGVDADVDSVAERRNPPLIPAAGDPNRDTLTQTTAIPHNRLTVDHDVPRMREVKARPDSGGARQMDARRNLHELVPDDEQKPEWPLNNRRQRHPPDRGVDPVLK